MLPVLRLDQWETLETNSSRTYFDAPTAPARFPGESARLRLRTRVPGVRPEQQFEAVLARVRHREAPAYRLARDDAAMRRLVETTRQRGWSVRAPDFGGDHDRPRSEVGDGRASIAMPIRSAGRLVSWSAAST